MNMPEAPPSRVVGSVLGLALGDAFGAPHEGGVPERLLWRLIGTRQGKRRWTDDTQMSIDVIESLVDCRTVDQNDLAGRFADSYRWSRGYGPGAARVLKRIRRGEPWESASRAVFADGSYGNGAAMRSPPVGLYFARLGTAAVAEAAERVATVTHAHPLAREGAVLIALATALAFQGVDSSGIGDRLAETAASEQHSKRLALARTWLRAGDHVAPDDVASRLGNGIAAIHSCTTAIYLAMRFLEATFDDLLAFTIKIGGDVDTIGAMACGIWGAARGFDELPRERLEELEDRDRLVTLAESFSDTIT